MTLTDIPRNTGDLGGQPKQTYWTPDGRMVRSLPDMHEYSQRVDGNVITGIRDANLDRGWLLQKPEIFKLYCHHCDLWHDSQPEIIKCGKNRDAFVARVSKKAVKENHVEDDRISRLENDMSEIKNLLKKLVKHG